MGLFALGGIFAYSGVKGKSISGSLKSLIAGNSPGDADTTNTISSTATGDGLTMAQSAQTPASADPATMAGSNQALGQLLATPYGWNAGQQWQDLVSLWNRESGWRNIADNPTSHAYGIAQALPSSKYPLAGQPASQGGSSDAATQIKWGLSYISSRYGNPSAAWAHETAQGWY